MRTPSSHLLSRPGRATASIACALSLGLLLLASAGCGGSDESNGAPADRDTASRVVECAPSEAALELGEGLDAQDAGTVLRLPLTTINRESGYANVRVTELVSASDLTSQDPDPVRYVVPGGRLVGVAFSVSNRGSEPIAPVDLGGRFFLIAGRDQEQSYFSVVTSDGCAGASLTMAGSPELPRSVRGKLVGPGFAIPPGEKSESLIVFAVPRKAQPSLWYSPLFDIAIDIG
jgi:hypothetical protein